MSTSEMKEIIIKKTEELSDIQLRMVFDYITKVDTEPITLISGDNVDRFFEKHSSLLKRLAE